MVPRQRRLLQKGSVVGRALAFPSSSLGVHLRRGPSECGPGLFTAFAALWRCYLGLLAVVMASLVAPVDARTVVVITDSQVAVTVIEAEHCRAATLRVPLVACRHGQNVVRHIASTAYWLADAMSRKEAWVLPCPHVC